MNPDGKAEEHLLGFSDVSEDRTAAKLKEEVDKYQCGEKPIAQTYNGASVMLGELQSGLRTRVGKDLTLFLFTAVTHIEFGLGSSYFVNQGVSIIKTISGLSAFFQKNKAVGHNFWSTHPHENCCSMSLSCQINTRCTGDTREIG